MTSWLWLPMMIRYPIDLRLDMSVVSQGSRCRMTQPLSARTADADADAGHLMDSGPDESHKERVNRELAELLQGLRVAVTGVQVLFAFLLTLPFAAGFPKVDTVGRWLFFISLMAAAAASICFIAPAAQHRLLFRTGLKERMLHNANGLGIAGALLLTLAMTSAVALVTEVVINSWQATLFGAAVALACGWLWFAQPLLTLYRHREDGDVKR
ncbi:DUF6328 family protein [Spongiactinospora sp. TRM90649]|uniref:DUF6328 family protein n=1 Tax=Spongiactinospora sp. TRM90649 TaxID=3031114 RepID=UPI0023F646B3|nr:DUF6328 family protein [Spongiactinospora sp. TRM90649]MDF5753191.1 DUF6328 family protein [Spongiactinospora sp. TRM90649]